MNVEVPHKNSSGSESPRLGAKAFDEARVSLVNARSVSPSLNPRGAAQCFLVIALSNTETNSSDTSLLKRVEALIETQKEKFGGLIRIMSSLKGNQKVDL